MLLEFGIILFDKLETEKDLKVLVKRQMKGLVRGRLWRLGKRVPFAIFPDYIVPFSLELADQYLFRVLISSGHIELHPLLP